MSYFKVKDINIITEIHDEEYKNFYIQAHCEIIEATNPIGGEAIIVNIVSPLYLENNLENSIKFGRGLILCNDYDKLKIMNQLQSLIEKSKSNTWQELSIYIEKYFNWV